ncbi:MAG TPA: asparagine synthase B [Candidatus Alectryocaccomicrobium excrementavium]|uniref:asparagine synthase (glutamine-hydrolyzing) n=1 Tax=Candidatus Alectryocaccomicrobium excrementavium TaxID=2840668 RepID=A0A9D1FYY4_9FIRM|nr:asparagine synthase B [Candidatus Alectryocaccomicrobium excrementavium]
MCSIFGVESKTVALAKLQECFERTAARGPDSERWQELPCGYLGFLRLSIMGLDENGMQPFALGDDFVVCNGELYGFRPLKERLRKAGYAFRGASDCEILLPLYREYGLDLFRTLDAEFALVLYDHRRGGLVAARDPIGIRPLYYGRLPDGAMAFASEPRALVGLCETILPFPPGCYWADGQFTRYADPAHVDQFAMVEEEAACAGLRRLLMAGVAKRLDADAPVGFLLSGGLDSSLVCAIAARQLPGKIRTFAIGMDTDAIDLKYARQVADFIGSEHTEVFFTQEDAIAALDTVVALLGTYDITTIRASIGMYLVCKYISEHTDIRVLLTGEISDELFGYKYTDFAPSPAEFQKEAEKRVRELHMYDVLRADRCISANSLEARVPFGDLAFVRYAMSIDPALKMNRHNMGKYLLRAAFAQDHLLPESILWRQKAAFSDAVGHSMVDGLKAYAEAQYSDAQFAARRAKYAHAQPFTKESLLYRELFEKHYPGQSQMVADFWMPNRAWPGCDVDDPSARVLKNYGDSGK